MSNMPKFYRLKPNDDLKIQDNFIFFDTETHIETDKDGNEKQTLKLGWAIHELNGKTENKYFETHDEFWNYLFSKIDYKHRKLIVFAHNMEFDFKIVNGYTHMLKKRKWNIKNFYIEGTTFILKMRKGVDEIIFLDSMNYVPTSLKKIGEAIGKYKGEVNFNTCTKEELKTYCLNDAEILHDFIMLLINFLKENNLTKLKYTSASLAFNSFRHRFYDYENYPIWIHGHHNAIALERRSYKGGITDCLKVGEFKDIRLFKVDINSMYPFIMSTYDMPTKLVRYEKSKPSMEILEQYIKTHHVIIDAEITLPKEYAYILTKQNIEGTDKCIFMHGTFNASIATPEIEFVLKHGKIEKINEIACYEKHNIFKDHVNFFYGMRKSFKDNPVMGMFTKLCLNCLYGKLASKNVDYEILDNECIENDIKIVNVIDNDGPYRLMHMGNKVIKLRKDDSNARDVFVAIPSVITSYSRMYLIELLLKAGRENVYYCDTDSLIVNEKGLNNLKEDISPDILGKLKNEGSSDHTIILKPKYYTFGDEIKCKGVKKTNYILTEDQETMSIAQKQFIRFKTGVRSGRYNDQYVEWVVKNISKKYDKGLIRDGGVIEPYHVSDLF